MGWRTQDGQVKLFAGPHGDAMGSIDTSLFITEWMIFRDCLMGFFEPFDIAFELRNFDPQADTLLSFHA